MTQWKTMHGEDGELLIFRRNILFAKARRFTCPLSRDTKRFESAGMSGDVVTGYSFQLVMNDIEIQDDISAKEIIRDIQDGKEQLYSFSGVYSRFDGKRERVALTTCLPLDTDVAGLINGFVSAWAFQVNITEDQMEKIWDTI